MRKTITMTHEQAVKLVSYLLMTTIYREGERNAWERLAAETNDDGAPKFPNASGNAKFWAEMDRDLEDIRKIIDDAPLLDE